MEQVFDSSTGVLLEEPDIEAIRAVRQLTLTFSKVLLPCTPARVSKAMSDYVQCDKEVSDVESCIADSDISEFGRMARLLYSDLTHT
jgi:hypothetical protein